MAKKTDFIQVLFKISTKSIETMAIILFLEPLAAIHYIDLLCPLREAILLTFCPWWISVRLFFVKSERPVNKIQSPFSSFADLRASAQTCSQSLIRLAFSCRFKKQWSWLQSMVLFWLQIKQLWTTQPHF